jgi:hypothetical protein
MSHDSRILIADLMFPEHVGSSQLGLASFDMTMFNMGGKERTEATFKLLLEDVGCELVQVWRSQEGFGVIVEGRLKGTKEKIIDKPLPESERPISEDTVLAEASDTKANDLTVEQTTTSALEQLSEPAQENVAGKAPSQEGVSENGNTEDTHVAGVDTDGKHVNGTSGVATETHGDTAHLNGDDSKDENKTEAKDEAEPSVPVNGN